MFMCYYDCCAFKFAHSPIVRTTLTSVINSVKAKVRNLVPANLSLGEYLFVYGPVAKGYLDNTSIKLFANKTDEELIKLTTKMAAALIMRPIQLKRNRPIIPITTGTYTPFARRMQTLAMVTAVPMLTLATYEIARRNTESPQAKRTREETLLRSRLSK